MTQSATFGAVLGSGATGSQVRTGLNLSDEAAATDHEGSSEPSVTYKFMRWRNDTAKLVRRRNAANSGWEIIENYGETSDPTTGDDSADGYIRGSVWINTSGNKVFFCSNPRPPRRCGCKPAAPAAAASPRCSAAPVRWWRPPATTPPTRS